jgi:hypothetical protein
MFKPHREHSVFIRKADVSVSIRINHNKLIHCVSKYGVLVLSLTDTK